MQQADTYTLYRHYLDHTRTAEHLAPLRLNPNPCYPAHVRLDTTHSDGGAHLYGNQAFLHVARMTKPEETERVQIYGLAQGDRVEFEIEAPKGGRQGRKKL